MPRSKATRNLSSQAANAPEVGQKPPAATIWFDTIAPLVMVLGIHFPAEAVPAVKHEPFTGAWRMALCDKQNPQVECGAFSLTLRQHGDTLCGSRFVITPGLSRQDEDESGSVIGTVAGNTAVLVIKSSRNGVAYLARATRVGRALQWKIVAPFTQGRSDESPLFPFDAMLPPSASPQQRQMLAALNRSCRWPQEVPAGQRD